MASGRTSGRSAYSNKIVLARDSRVLNFLVWPNKTSTHQRGDVQMVLHGLNGVANKVIDGIAYPAPMPPF